MHHLRATRAMAAHGAGPRSRTAACELRTPAGCAGRGAGCAGRCRGVGPLHRNRGPAPAAPPTDAEKVAQCLQLVGLHRSDHRAGVREGIRHQGQLRRVRLERGARDQAARRQHRLRRGGAVGVVPAAPDPGRSVSEARQVAAAESQEPRSRHHAPHRGERSGQSVRCRTTCGARRESATTSSKVASAMPNAPVDSFAMLLRPERREELPEVRRLDPRLAD